jgi:preprotein translocase subunit YajC
MQNLGPLLTVGIFILVMYFLLIRPQQKRMAEQARLVRSLEVGDEVMTSAGIFGRIRRMNDERIELETAGGTRLEVLKSSVVRRIGEDMEQRRELGPGSSERSEAGRSEEDADSVE